MAIVAGVVILVVVVFVLTLTGANAPQYQAEDTPQGVVHNYLLALQRKDYKRAYSYLSPGLAGYPVDLDQFVADVNRFKTDVNRPPYDVKWNKDEAAQTFESAGVEGDNAWVTVRRPTSSSRDLIDGGQDTYSFSVKLDREDDAWKISWAEWYWHACWTNPGFPGCR